MTFAVFCLYLVVLLGIGTFCAHKNKTLGDFILGGRRLGPYVTAISAQASDMSAWLLIGLPGAAYAGGLSLFWTVVGCACGTIFNWVVVAPRLRRVAGATDSLTVPDVLEAGLGGGRSPFLRGISVLAILLFYASYIAAQFIAAGKVFETTFREVSFPFGQARFTYETGLIVGGGVILLYTMLGGFFAVAYTDLLQGLLMIFGVVVLPAAAFLALPRGEDLGVLLTASNPAYLSLFCARPGTSFFFGTLIGNLSWAFGYPGQPHIVARFMAIRDPAELRRAAVVGIGWVVVALAGAFCLGIIGAALLGGELKDRDMVMPLLAHRLLPPVLEGVLIAAAVAAMMSTVDSQVIVAVAAVQRDLLERLFGVRLKPRAAVLLARCVTLLLGGAGIAIALRRQNVFAKVFDAWGGLGATLAPALLLSLLWRKARRWGVVAGMAAGFLTVQVWPAGEGAPSWASMGALVPGFFANLCTAAAVSAALSWWESSRRPLPPLR